MMLTRLKTSPLAKGIVGGFIGMTLVVAVVVSVLAVRHLSADHQNFHVLLNWAIEQQKAKSPTP